jgi:hypothetical protein
MRGDAAHDRFRPLSHASENGFATAKNGFFGTWFGGGGAPLLKSQAGLVNSCAASVCGREQILGPGVCGYAAESALQNGLRRSRARATSVDRSRRDGRGQACLEKDPAKSFHNHGNLDWPWAQASRLSRY